MISVVIHGHSGKLGKRIISNLSENYSTQYIGFVDRLYDFTIIKNSTNVVLVDVSTDEGCDNLVSKLIDQKLYVPLLVGTTGNLPYGKLTHYSKHAPVYVVSNFSNGMRSLLNIIDKVKIPNSTTTIVELHHVHKKDSPSGTAKSIADRLNYDHTKINSIREGEIYGIHEVTIENEHERIIIKHEIKDPNIFAQGAIHFIKEIIHEDIGLNIF